MPGRVSTGTLEQIRAASDIVDVIGSMVPLKRAGGSFVALCPFHKEKTPSFHVNPHRQIFHCFGCHKGGDVFSFVQEYENISFMEAVRRMAERARIPLAFESGGGGDPGQFQKEKLLEIHEQITQRWHAALTNEAAGEMARAYLAKRGVSDEAVKLFRIGCAPNAWDDTVNWAKAKGYDLPLVEQAGLVIRKEGEAHFYDRFRGRLIFPICDEQGRVVGFSGRILEGDEKTAKYVNSPETPIFAKGRIFYGLDKSKRALLDAGFAVICEGQLDLIACYMAGVRQVVAPQGTAFTSDHARILKRYVNEVVLCFDSDTAGQAAAVRVLDSLLASGLAIRVARLPPSHDPDSYIKAFGGQGFRQLIEQAPGFFDYYLDRLCETHDLRSDKGQLAIVKAMAEAVHKTGHLVLVDRYAQQTALRLGVSLEAMRQEFKRAARSPSRAPAEKEEKESRSAESVRPSAQEFWLLKLALLHDDVIDWLVAHLDLSWVAHPGVRDALSKRLGISATDPSAGMAAAALLHNLDDAGTQSLVTEAMADDRPIPNAPQQIEDLVLRLRNQSIDRQISALTLQLSAADSTDALRVSVLQQQQELRSAKRQPLRPKNEAI